MRIAILGHKQIGVRSGGIEKTVYEIALRLTERGHDITVFDRWPLFVPATRNTEDRLEKIRIRRIPTLRGKAEVPLYSLLASVAAGVGKYDVVIFNASGPSLMIPVTRVFGKKTISFIHGLDSKSVKWGRFASQYLRMGEKTAARYADRVLVLSEHIRAHFISEYGIEPELVFNGIDMPESVSAEYESAVLSRYSLKKDGYFLWTGRISREKGIQYLLKAFTKCKTDKMLVIAGSGGTGRTVYEKQVAEESSGDKRVLLTGLIDPEDLTVLYRNCFAFVFPSESEGMPHSLLEALSCGAQCAASDIPENRALAGEHGLYFRSTDVEDIQNCLNELLADPDSRYQRTADEAKEITGRYEWEKAADLIEEICLDIIGKAE
ncbi:MAG: glycosyltransferase family 4 protein [Oscillospiraceae bacterium]|nr:glycosyltransferase family 4 protein [Oscillospiraceae bacterium]